MTRIEVLRATTYVLLKMGFQASQRGYRYLREAVWVSYEEPDSVTSVTKLLYPKVAKNFNTTDKQVERAIRNSIETAWIKGNKAYLCQVVKDYCQDKENRPTNTEVIAALVAYIQNELNANELFELIEA